MKTKKSFGAALIFIPFLIAVFMFTGCPPFETDTQPPVLNLQIDKDNDSLLTFDTVIVKVYSKDSSFSQEVFHGKLTVPKQVQGLELDPRVGTEFKISIIGYRNGKIGVSKEVTFVASGEYQSKDVLPPDTVKIDTKIPEILAPSDTSVREGDSLGFVVSVRNPLNGKTTLTLKSPLPGVVLDTVGRNPGEGFFSWKPSLSQGRIESYAVILVYASTDRKVEKTMMVKVLNKNQSPKLKAISDQKVEVNETIAFKVEATDADLDSLTYTVSGLPEGAIFSSGLFSWKPTSSQVGNYPLTFKVSDSQESDLIAVLVTVGNIAVPQKIEVKITYPGRDTVINFTPINVLFTVNGVPSQRRVDLRSEKTKLFVDTTIDGRTAFDTVTIILDTVPPFKPLISGNSPIRTRMPSWTWSGGGGGIGIFRYRLDNEDLTATTALAGNVFTASNNLDTGTHTLFVQERDAAGNWSQTGKHPVRIDTTRPSSPTITTNPLSPTFETRPTWNWNGTGNDVAGIFRFQMDKADFQDGSTETTAMSYRPEAKDALKEGEHILYVQQRDSAGNWSNSASASIVVDLTSPAAPSVTTIQSSPTKTARPSWSWTSNESNGVGIFRVKLDDSILTSGAISGTSLNFTPTEDLKEGVHTLYVQERDAANNWSTLGSRTISIDLTPPIAPVFEPLPRSPLNSLQPTWGWKSGGGGSGFYRLRINDSDWTKSTDTTRQNSYKSSVLTEGVHTLFVQERDEAGNWSATASRTLVLASRGDVGGVGFTAGAARELSLTFAKDGITPYLAFSDEANDFKTTVMRFNGSSWEIVGKAGFSPGVAYTNSLAISNSGIPYVAFMDAAHENKITVMWFNGGTWEVVGAPGISQGNSFQPSLALNKSGIPYVVFRDIANGRKATAIRFNGGFWEKVGDIGFTQGGASSISLAFNSAGTPHVAYCNDSVGNQPTVMRFNGTSWENFSSIPVSTVSASSTTLVFNSLDVPYVSYSDASKQEKANVKRFVGSGWESVGSSGFSTGSAFSLSLAISNDGLPHVAFADGVNGRRANLMRFNGNDWESIGGVSGLSTGGAFFTVVAINKNGVPYMGFLDVANGDRGTVVKSSLDP